VALDDLHVAIEDERGRQRADAGEELLDFRCEHHHRVIDPVLGGEFRHDERRSFVLGYTYDLQPIRVLLLKRDEIGNLRAGTVRTRSPRS